MKIQKLDGTQYDVQEIQDTGWIDVNFEEGWHNYGQEYNLCSYRKINNCVYLQGLAQRDSRDELKNTLFNLPVGFRPNSKIINIGVIDYNRVLRVDIDVQGNVNLAVYGNEVPGLDWISLNNISFYID